MYKIIVFIKLSCLNSERIKYEIFFQWKKIQNSSESSINKQLFHIYIYYLKWNSYPFFKKK